MKDKRNTSYSGKKKIFGQKTTYEFLIVIHWAEQWPWKAERASYFHKAQAMGEEATPHRTRTPPEKQVRVLSLTLPRQSPFFENAEVSIYGLFRIQQHHCRPRQAWGKLLYLGRERRPPCWLKPRPDAPLRGWSTPARRKNTLLPRKAIFSLGSVFPSQRGVTLDRFINRLLVVKTECRNAIQWKNIDPPQIKGKGILIKHVSLCCSLTNEWIN